MIASKLPPRLKAGDDLIDDDAVAELRRRVGEAVCRELLCDAMMEATERLARLESALGSQDLRLIRLLAADLATVAGRVGMTRTAAVSRDLSECAARAAASPTIGAVGDRLLRAGAETLAAFPSAFR